MNTEPTCYPAAYVPPDSSARQQAQAYVPMPAVVSYDPAASAIYIRLSESKIARHHKVGHRLTFDLDPEGGLVGIEIAGVAFVPNGQKTER